MSSFKKSDSRSRDPSLRFLFVRDCLVSKFTSSGFEAFKETFLSRRWDGGMEREKALRCLRGREEREREKMAFLKNLDVRKLDSQRVSIIVRISGQGQAREDAYVKAIDTRITYKITAIFRET